MDRGRGSARRGLARGAWGSAALAIGLAGVAASYALLGTANAVLLGALCAFLTASTGWLLRTQELSPRRVPPLPLVATLGGATGLAIVGLVVALGPIGLVVSVAVVVPGWWVLSPPRDDDGGRASGVRIEAEQLPPDPLPALSSLAALDTAALCRTWQLTYPRLLRATSPSEIEYLTDLRRRCLAEFQQRDPVAFGRWLPTARAAGDPARFFCRPVRRPTGEAAP